jgi:hypothetical protein
MANHDLGKKRDVEAEDEGEKIPTRRYTASDLPAAAQVVHSNETDDAPQREVHEAYTDENIEKLKENSSPSTEGEELTREARRIKRDGSSGETPDSGDTSAA